MKKAITLFSLLISMVSLTQAQQADTITVELARTSKIVFTMQDKKDLEQLKHYDFDALFEDMLSKLEDVDTLNEVIIDTSMVKMNESPLGEEDVEWDLEKDI